MDDCCKVVFYVLTSMMMSEGLLLAGIGFYGPSLFDDKGITDNKTNRYDTQLEVALFGIGLAGLVIVGLGVLGIFAVYRELRLLSKIFRICLIISAVLIWSLAVLAFTAVYLRTVAFKSFWRPKMEKYNPSDPMTLIHEDVVQVHAMQMRVPCCGLSGEDVYMKGVPPSCCYNSPNIPTARLVNPIDPKSMGSTLALDKQLSSMIPDLIGLASGCTKKKLKEINRKPCDVAGSEGFIAWGRIVAYLSAFTGMFLCAVTVLAFCVKPRRRDDD